MDQFVPAEWRTSSMGEAVAPLSCGEDDGLVELLCCGGHVAREHEAAPWFHYPVVDDPLDKDIFSEIFGEMQAAAADAGWVAGASTTGYSAPPRGSDAMSYHDATTTATSPSTRPRAPGSGKRKQRDASESPSEAMQDGEGSDSAAEAMTTRGPTTAKRRRAAQEHNLSERRRRDRINEKMRALQELVPHCNKTDKASMLDEAIQYLKSLQLQVQMMWTTGMAPAPATGAHRYMQRMASTRFRMPLFMT